jgi:hypothetical protein
MQVWESGEKPVRTLGFSRSLCLESPTPRVFRWLRKKHPTRNIPYLKRRYWGGRWRIHEGDVELFRPSKVKVERYRNRGTRILLPRMEPTELGAVGRYALTAYDDLHIVGALDEELAA